MLWALLLTLSATPVQAAELTIPIQQIIEAKQLEDKLAWIDHLATCESGNNPTIKILDTNNFYSYGYVQFQMATWLANGGVKADIYNKDAQKKVAMKMLDAGGTHNWYNCNKIIRKTYGDYPATSSVSPSM